MILALECCDMKYSRREIAGVILWWAEGTKARKDRRWKNTWTYHVDFTNTDAKMIKIFLDFLRFDIGVQEERLKLQLQIHDGDNQETLEKFWSELTEIPRNRFTKTIVRNKGRKIGKNRGTCKIRYCDKLTYLKLSQMLNDVLSLIAEHGNMTYTLDRVVQAKNASGAWPNGKALGLGPRD